MFLKIEEEVIKLLKLRLYSDSEVPNETVCKEVTIKEGDIVKVLYIEDSSIIKPIEITGRLTRIEHFSRFCNEDMYRGKRSYINIDCSKEYYNDIKSIFVNRIRDIEVIDDNQDNNTETNNPNIDDNQDNKEDIQDEQDITSDIPDGD